MQCKPGELALVWRNSTPIKAQNALIGMVVQLLEPMQCEIVVDGKQSLEGVMWTYYPTQYDSSGPISLVSDADLMPYTFGDIVIAVDQLVDAFDEMTEHLKKNIRKL